MTDITEADFYDPNVDDRGVAAKAKLPNFRDELVGTTFLNGDAYLRYAESVANVSKAVQPVPNAQTFANISYMPTTSGKNIVEWPGIDPRSLKKVCEENFAPQMIVQMRVNDILRYSRFSNHPWKPGWKIELMQGNAHPTDVQKRQIQEAIAFLHNCNAETAYTDVVERDSLGLSSFQTWLSEMVRDTMRFDGIATWTQRDQSDRVVAFASLPAYAIRLCTKEGYNGDPTQYAVLVDDTNNPQESFSRKELIWTVRNPRTDNDVHGYGYPESGMSIELISAFQNAFRLNSSTFDKSSIPNGILMLKGDYWTQRQVDLLSRAWLNMKKGISKTWVLPAINVPKDGEMEILNLQELKGTEVRYKDFMNMLAGVFCALWGFPSSRLGYHPSGHTKDAEVNPDESTAIQGDDDPGLAPLLITIERVVNYLIWSRWPDLVFAFTGKNPKEDAREYEARSQARTMKERRAEADLPSLEDSVAAGATPAEKIIARLMDQCPTDANQTGTYTSLASIVIKYILGIEDGSEGDEKDKGAKTGEKKDPAKSESHGHMSGVRRDSAAEKGKKVG